MERVRARRDENWKKLQQYVLEERETLDVTGPGGARLFRFRRDYSWFLREGVFIRSPLRADGVTMVPVNWPTLYGRPDCTCGREPERRGGHTHL